MYSLSDRFLMLLPGLLAVLFALFAAVPLEMSRLTVTPNPAWLMTVAMAALYPPAWAFWFAFSLGLVQDVLYGTPLGSQALLALLLWLVLRMRPARVANPLFRYVWAEAVVLMVVWHGLLWVLLWWVGPKAPPLLPLLGTGLVQALWFPLLYWPSHALTALLPPRG